MPDETTTSTVPTPGQVATNEIAKQAVLLVFGLISAVIVVRLQTRMAQQMAAAMRDPDSARTQRMQDAKRLEGIWSKVADWTGKAAMLAWKQADKARAAYDKDRPE